MNKRNISLFVWGTLKKGQINHYYLENAVFIGKGITKEKFIRTGFIELYLCNDYYKNKFGRDCVNIEGEIYLINEEELNRIDLLEGFPHLYKRRLVSIISENNKEYKCWMYYLEREESE